MKRHWKKIAYLVLFTSLLILFFSTGGMVVTILEDRVHPITTTMVILGTVAAVAFAATFLCWRWLQRAGDELNGAPRRELLFNTVLFIVLTSITLVLMNVAASFYVAPWPMSGLHGVSTEVGKNAWLYHGNSPGFVPANSWGQRDREHPIIPRPGTYRTIFIGDSFLENGAAVPLPYRTEEMLKGMGQMSQELINLGVSATDPDEYFFRLKRVGLPLKPNHCIYLFSAGTDFIQEPTLLSYAGISATYPRWSFLQLLGLYSLDQVISNERRQVLRAWFKGGSLLKHELELQNIFGKTTNDQETEKEYLSFFPFNEQQQLKSVLHQRSAADRSRLFQMLRKPDDGIFRSYFLNIATNSAKGLPPAEFLPAEYSFRWVKAAYELCKKSGIAFTLVVVPDAFAVDSRMRDQYAALADMKVNMQQRDEASNRLIKHAVDDGMDVVDLWDLLRNAPGAYLNMDGHWSQKGVDIVAVFLAEKLNRKDDVKVNRHDKTHRY